MVKKDEPATEPLSKRLYEKIFGGSHHVLPKDRALEYVIHRIEHGGHLESVVQEPYVRRNCTRGEIDEIVKDPRVVHAARNGMEQTFRSGELDPKTVWWRTRSSESG